jgi:hypothetical protein
MPQHRWSPNGTVLLPAAATLLPSRSATGSRKEDCDLSLVWLLLALGPHGAVSVWPMAGGFRGQWKSRPTLLRCGRYSTMFLLADGIELPPVVAVIDQHDALLAGRRDPSLART